MARNAVERLAEAVGEVAGHEVVLDRPKDSDFGDYATNVALQRAKTLRRPPRELAEELAAKVVSLPEVERAEVAGPGFVNLWLADSFFVEALEEIGDDYGASSATSPERVQVELVSANPTGPITVASGRNGAYGDSVARLLEFAGHAVEREYYFNDAGAQMERFRLSVDAARRGEEPPEDGYHGDYIADLAREEGDPVPRMLERIRATLDRFRIEFDTWQNELDLAAKVPLALERIDTYEADGTLWARTSAHGDEKDRPLLRSADGSTLYYASDVAYVLDKFERGFERAIYVLGADHHGYVARLKAAAAMLGYDPERVEVLLYQLVHLTRGGEQTKMSKRRGDVVFLDEFLDEIGVDAARWYLVNRGPDQTIEIDIDLAAEKTQKNPVYYVQYAHARIAGILRNADGHADRRPLARRAGAGRARAGQAARGLPDARARGDRPAWAADAPVVRDPRRRRLPPLLPRRPRARLRGRGVPARALPRDPAGDRALPRPDRCRGARAHVDGSRQGARGVRLHCAAMRVGMLTGGGDCPGLNPVIRAVCRRLWEHGHETFGVLNGWRGMIDGDLTPLGYAETSGILHKGGTIIGTSRTNPFKSDGGVEGVKRTFEAIDALVAIGGEDTLGVAARLFAEEGLPVVGVPKTIDNDLNGTDYTFGFDTAVTVATEAIDRCHSTAESHNRIIVVETMGRHAGWIALFSGIAGGADYILIPEQPVDYDAIAAAVERRRARGKNFSVIVASEGSELPGVSDEGEVDDFGHVRVENRAVGPTVAQEVEARTGMQTRATVLGYIQRGGSPTPRDRILGLRFGLKAADLVQAGNWGQMAALHGDAVVSVPLTEATAELKLVSEDWYETAKTFFG